jgi:hypothetical protein
MSAVSRVMDTAFEAVSKPAMCLAEKLDSHHVMKRNNFRVLCGIVTVVAGVILLGLGMAAQLAATTACPVLAPILLGFSVVSGLALLSSIAVRYLPMSEPKRAISCDVCTIIGLVVFAVTIFPVPGAAVTALGIHMLRKVEEVPVEFVPIRD